MPKRIDPVLPTLSVLGYWAITLGTLEVQVRPEMSDSTERGSLRASRQHYLKFLTWTLKVCERMAFWAMFRGFGQFVLVIWNQKHQICGPRMEVLSPEYDTTKWRWSLLYHHIWELGSSGSPGLALSGSLAVQ